MIKIIKPRCHGKTTDLLRIAAEKDYILVEPNIRMAQNAAMLADEMGIKVEIITAHDLIGRYFRRMREYADKRYLIDEIEMFLLEIARVEGFSDTSEDIVIEPKKDFVKDHSWDFINYDPFVGAGW